MPGSGAAATRRVRGTFGKSLVGRACAAVEVSTRDEFLGRQEGRKSNVPRLQRHLSIPRLGWLSISSTKIARARTLVLRRRGSSIWMQSDELRVRPVKKDRGPALAYVDCMSVSHSISEEVTV